MNTSVKILFILILFGTISCNTSLHEPSFKKVEDTYRPVNTDEKITEDLEFAYKAIDPDLINNIFTEWHKTVRPSAPEFINQNDTISAIYEIFNTFFKPNNFLKFGNWGYRNSVKSKYIVIQNTISYSILYSKNINKVDEINSRRRLLSNFRPPISSGNNNILYLTEEYAESLNNFLGTETKQAGDNQMNNPSGYRVEKLVKAELLRSYIPVNYDYLDRYWYFESHPYINKIIFNKTMNKAKIDFFIGQQGGEAIFKKAGANWVITVNKTILSE